MAEKYYSLEEVMEKLVKSEEQIRQLVEEGKLHEFREEGNVLYKAEEVEGFSEDTEVDIEEDFTLDVGGEEGSSIELLLNATSETESSSAPVEESGGVEFETGGVELESDAVEFETGGVELESGEAELEADAAELVSGISAEMDISELSSADTSIGTTGINVLGDTDDEYKLASDSKGETVGAESTGTGAGTGSGLADLDADINMDSIGSGSGLLDLSLQADDTSLGAVLDDILPTGEGEEAPLTPEETNMAEEADKIFEEADPNEAVQSVSEPGVMAQYFEPAADSLSNACGIMLIIPFLALIYAVIVIITGLRDISPGILKIMEGAMYGMATIWIVAGVLAVVILFIFGIASMMGGKDKKIKKDDVYEQPVEQPVA